MESGGSEEANKAYKIRKIIVQHEQKFINGITCYSGEDRLFSGLDVSSFF